MQSNQPHADISHRREKTKLQSGTETALISGGDSDGGKCEEEEQARTLSHTHSHTSGECLGPAAWKSLEQAENWGKTDTQARSRAHAEAYEYAGTLLFLAL